jgi:hypothetical protein
MGDPDPCVRNLITSRRTSNRLCATTFGEFQEQIPATNLTPTPIGMNAILEIEHNRGERTWANIVSIRRPPTGDRVLKIPEDYKRAKVSSNKQPATVTPLNDHGVDTVDSDIPF